MKQLRSSALGLEQPGAGAAPRPVPAASLDPYDRPNAPGLLAVLTLCHFFNDVCIGIAAPMIPTLEAKFGMGLGAVAGMIAILTLTGNFSQPFAGWFADRSRTLTILLVTPLISGLAFFTGFAREPWQVGVLFFFSGLAVGTFHPFAFVCAPSTLPRRPALATSIFISGGFIGVAYGARISGYWMEARGFEHFHYLYFGSFAVVAVLLIRGIPAIKLADHRLFKSAAGGHDPDGGARTIPFGLLLTLGVLFGLSGGTFMFFVPKLYNLLYQSEGKGGNATFLFGLSGGLTSYFYAWRAERRGSKHYKVALIAMIAGILPVIGFFYFPGDRAKTLMMVLAGMSVGGIFPMLASLARRARGLTVGTRSALMLGGVWGTVTLINVGMGWVADGLTPRLGEALALERAMTYICFVPLVLGPLLIYSIRRYEA